MSIPYDPKDPDGVQAKKILAQLDDPAFAAFRSTPTTLSRQITARTSHPVLSLSKNDEGFWLHVEAPNGLKADIFLLAATLGHRTVGRVLKSALEAQKP